MSPTRFSPFTKANRQTLYKLLGTALTQDQSKGHSTFDPSFNFDGRIHVTGIRPNDNLNEAD